MLISTQDLIEHLGKMYRILDGSKNMDTCRQASKNIRAIEQELKNRQIKYGLESFF